MIRRALHLTLVLAFCVSSVGCYRFTVRPKNTEIAPYHGETVHSYGWNLIKPDPILETEACADKGLYAARAKTNLLYLWVGALTFGGWVPMRLEYRCVELAE